MVDQQTDLEIIGIEKDHDVQSAIVLLEEGFLSAKEYWLSALSRRLNNYHNLIYALRARVPSLGFLFISFPNIYPYNTTFIQIKDPTPFPILLKPNDLIWKVNKLYSEDSYLGRL